MMKWLRLILSMAVLIISTAVRGQYNPENPPEPGSKYTLSLRVYPYDSGSFSPSSGGRYEPGQRVDIRASAAANFRFLHWEDDEGTVVSTDASFRYTMPLRDVTLTARFSYDPGSPGEPDEPQIPKYSKLYVTVTPEDGGRTNVEREQRCEVGSIVSLRAYNNTDFVFRRWTKDGAELSTDPNYSYMVTEEDAHIVANFDYKPGSPEDPPVGIVSHKVYLDCYPEGACRFSRDSGYRVLEGADVEVRAYTNTYYHFVNWTCDGEPIEGGEYLKYKMPGHDIHLTANFTYDYAPDLPGEPTSAENMAAVYGLTDYVAIKERHLYPIYLDNTLHKAKGMVIDVQFPAGFDVEIDHIQKTRITESHQVNYEVVGDNNYRITTLGTDNTLEHVTAIAMLIPVNIPETAQIDSTYFVRVHYGVLTNMDNSQTPLRTHNGGLRIMESGYCRITTSVSQYGTIKGGGTYKIGDTVTLTAQPYEGCEFVSWTDGTSANPYVFEAKESMVIGAIFRDLGYIPDYPVIDDLQAQADSHSVTLTWTAPDLTQMWQGCIEALVPEDELPQLAGYNVYRDGHAINDTIVTETVYIDNNVDIYTGHTYTVTAVFSNRHESEHSNAAVTEARVMDQCPVPAISYDGRYVRISAGEGCTVRYTLDGTMPTAQSAVYDGPIDVGGIVDVTAISVMADHADSEPAAMHVPVYFDGTVATVDQAGALASGFGWTTPEIYTRLVVRGNINAADVQYATGMSSIDMLDLGATALDGSLSNGFGTLRARHLIAPGQMDEAQGPLFAACPRLCAVEWRSERPLTAAAMEDCANPNMLVYVDGQAAAPEDWTNTVVDGTARVIHLVDGGDFYCPISFTADTISYTHHYGKTSAIGGLTAGWEALALPFDVDSIEHETAGRIVPFAANTDYWETRPFWLEAFGESGFEPATEISANTPYLICMPNNEIYDPRFILEGNVTFIAVAKTVPVTTTVVSRKGDYAFVPTMVTVAKSDTVALINHEYIEADKCQPGEVFVAGVRDAMPFEAYITRGGEPITGPLHVAELQAEATGIEDILALESTVRVYATGRVLHIETDRPMGIGIYTADGIMVYKARLVAGDNTVDSLAPGLYIAAGTKVMLR